MSTHIPGAAVVVGVDGSDHSAVALAWALQLAQREDRPLVIAHATGRLTSLHPIQGRTAERHERRIPGRRIVDGALRLARAAAPDLAIETVVRVDDPVPVLIELAQEAALVVVGSGGRGHVSSLVVGSVSVAVSEAAPCPVVVVRTRASVTATRVLAAVSGTDDDADVLEFAARHVDPTSGSLVAVHAVPELALALDDLDLRGWDIPREFRARHRELGLRVAGVSGPLDAYLLKESRSAALVVLPAHGGSRWGATLRGSPSQHVIESAACSVAVVPSRSAASTVGVAATSRRR